MSSPHRSYDADMTEMLSLETDSRLRLSGRKAQLQILHTTLKLYRLRFPRNFELELSEICVETAFCWSRSGDKFASGETHHFHARPRLCQDGRTAVIFNRSSIPTCTVFNRSTRLAVVLSVCAWRYEQVVILLRSVIRCVSPMTWVDYKYAVLRSARDPRN